MAEILSQQQIDAILGSFQTGKFNLHEEDPQQKGPKIKEYDFMSPKKFTKEHMKLLDGVFNNFARMFGLYLTSTLRCVCQLEVLQIEEEEYREFNNALNDSILAGIFTVKSTAHDIEEKPVLTDVSRPVFFSVMDRLLGGNGEGYFIERECTDIELALLEYLYKQMQKFLDLAWANYFEVEHNLQRLETNSRLIQLIQPDEAVAIVVIEVTLPNLKGNLNVCLPASSLADILKAYQEKFLKSGWKENSESEKKRRENILEGLYASELSIRANLGRASLTLEEILQLKQGDVILLDTLANSKEIELCVEDSPWFSGELGVRKKKYAVKIHEKYNIAK